MISQIRKLVAGPKKRTVFKNYDLDFTYITDTVIAMAYPASGLEQTYRNSIYDVAEYLETKHPEYLIINVSNRKYDEKVFKDKVKCYEWEDHQAPCLDVLFSVANDSYEFLAKGNTVVCFHCNHGKGRTGTAIISLFLFSGFFKDIVEALNFYNKKRFNQDNYGVSQPCQIRYLEYFLSALREVQSKNYRKNIKAYRIYRVEFEGLPPSEYEMNIYSTRTQKTKYEKIPLGDKADENSKTEPLLNDVYIEVKKKGWIGDTTIARANINLNFLKNISETETFWSMQGNEVRLSASHHGNFMIDFFFTEFCNCHNEEDPKCECNESRKVEQKCWENLINLAKMGNRFNSRETCKMLYPSLFLEEETEKNETISPN